MVKAAGVYGNVLDQLLMGMVSVGILTMTNTVNGPVYRSPLSA